MVLPDYHGQSIVNLMSSIRQGLGATPLRYAPLSKVDLPALVDNRHLVLIVIDGLGYNFLRHSEVAPTLNGHLSARLTSVFPSTTASAITTYLTGLAPQQHGLVGWFMHFPEIQGVFTPLPFTPRNPEQPSPDLSPSDLFDHQPIFDSPTMRTYSVAPARIAYSPFNQFHTVAAETRPYQTLTQMFEQLTDIVTHADEQSFAYAYYPEIDSLAHAHGIGSEQVARELEQLDRAFETFLATISGAGTTVVLSADHGFVDPPLSKCLELADFLKSNRR